MSTETYVFDEVVHRLLLFHTHKCSKMWTSAQWFLTVAILSRTPRAITHWVVMNAVVLMDSTNHMELFPTYMALLTLDVQVSLVTGALHDYFIVKTIIIYQHI